MASTGSTAAAAPAWYRQRWPWLLMAPPAVAVVGCIATITLAVRSADGVVAADYYKRGLAINEQMDRSQLAATLGLRAELVADGLRDSDGVRLQISADTTLPPDAVLTLRLVHPGKQSGDRIAQLARTTVGADGRSASYVGRWQTDAADAGTGVSWRLVLEGGRWRLDADASRLQDGRLAVSAGRG